MDKREKYLQEFLRDGETVQWKSTPNPVELLDADNGNSIIKRWTITTLITLALLSSYIGYLEVKPELVALVLFIAVYNILAPIEARRAINKNLSYYITDQRIILGGRNAAFYFMELNEIDEIRVVTGLTGNQSLVVGSAIFPKCEKNMRWQSLHPKDDPDPMPEAGHVLGMTIYEPKNVEGALGLLQGRVKMQYVDRSAPARSVKEAA